MALTAWWKTENAPAEIWCFSSGALLAYFSWGDGLAPAGAVFLPLACFAFPLWQQRWLVAAGYISVSSASLLLTGQPSTGGLSIGSCIVSVALWAFAFTLGPLTNHSKLKVHRFLRVPLSAMLGSAILLLPPLWQIGVAHPVLAVGHWSPGAGFVGVGVYLALVAVASIVQPPSVQGSCKVAGIAVICAGAVAAMSARELAPMNRFASIFAATVPWTVATNSSEASESIARMRVVARAAKESGFATLVFPTLLSTTDRNCVSALGSSRIQDFPPDVEIVLGVECAKGTPHASLAVVSVAAGVPTEVGRRQPFLVSASALDRVGLVPSSLATRDPTRLQQGLALVAAGREEASIGRYLPTIWAQRPNMLLSVSHTPGMPDKGVDMLLARHAAALGLLFGIPVVRAATRTLS